MLEGECQTTGCGRTRFRVALEAEHNFGCAVPPRRYVFRHVARVLLRVYREPSCQPKVTYLQLAVCVDKEVTRFEVAVQDVCGVNIL